MINHQALFVLVRNLRNIFLNLRLRTYSNCVISVSALFDKALTEKYTQLPIPECTTITDYIWIDGSGIHMRSKTRTLNCWPRCIAEVPQWHMDGAKTQQALLDDTDIRLLPVAMYKDPLRGRNGVHANIILCETYDVKGKPTSTNRRQACCRTFCESKQYKPRFAFEQEYMLMQIDGRPLGWPCAGGEMPPTGRYYCAVGAANSIGRDIVEAHYRACLYAGIALEGFNSEQLASKWKFHIAPSGSIKGPDDVIVARYLLARIAEQFGVEASFHPKVFPHKEGAALHVNFSSKAMQQDGGIKAIEGAGVVAIGT